MVTDTLFHLITEHCQEVHKRVGTTREFRFDLGYAAAAHEVSVFIRKSPISGGHETQRATEAGTVNSTGNAIPRTNPLDLVLEQRRQGLRLPLVSRRTALWKGSEFMRRPLGPVDAPQKVVPAAFTIE